MQQLRASFWVLDVNFTLICTPTNEKKRKLTGEMYVANFLRNILVVFPLTNPPPPLPPQLLKERGIKSTAAREGPAPADGEPSAPAVLPARAEPANRLAAVIQRLERAVGLVRFVFLVSFPQSHADNKLSLSHTHYTYKYK